MTMPSQIDIVKRHIEAALASGGKALLGGPESVKGPFIDRRGARADTQRIMREYDVRAPDADTLAAYPPGIPNLRRFQAAQALATLDWLRSVG